MPPTRSPQNMPEEPENRPRSTERPVPGGETLMRTLLPPDVCVAETRRDFGNLLAAEREYFARAVEKRVREAQTVRACARAALTDLYRLNPHLRQPQDEHNFVPRPDGSPVFPHGTVGSMTHCAGYRAAAVGLASRYACIGLDAEPAVPLSQAVREVVVRREEEPFTTAGCASKVLFSAKESVFKIWYPLGVRGIDLRDISVALDPEALDTTALDFDVPEAAPDFGAPDFAVPESAPDPADARQSAPKSTPPQVRGTFTARIPNLPGIPRLHGRWALANGLVATAAVLPAPHLT